MFLMINFLIRNKNKGEKRKLNPTVYLITVRFSENALKYKNICFVAYLDPAEKYV